MFLIYIYLIRYILNIAIILILVKNTNSQKRGADVTMHSLSNIVPLPFHLQILLGSM